MRTLSETEMAELQAIIEKRRLESKTAFNPNHYRAGDRFKIKHIRKEGDTVVSSPHYLYFVDATPNILTFQNAERNIFTIGVNEFIENLECGDWVLNNPSPDLLHSTSPYRDHRLGF